MLKRVRVKFGTTEDKVREALVRKCTDSGIDATQACFVLDLAACTLTETAYALSDAPEQLPPHPNGPAAIRKVL